MAYDKVVDSAVLEAAIKASANAIREKTGDTALIEWLQDTGFAEAIALIEAGGGMNVASGYFVPAEDTKEITIIHGLGVVPAQFWLIQDKIYSPNNEGFLSLVCLPAGYSDLLAFPAERAILQRINSSSLVNGYRDDLSTFGIVLDENNFTTKSRFYSTFKASRECYWVAIG